MSHKVTSQFLWGTSKKLQPYLLLGSKEEQVGMGKGNKKRGEASGQWASGGLRVEKDCEEGKGWEKEAMGIEKVQRVSRS